MSFKLSYNTNGWVSRPLEDALRFIAKCGYEGVDLLCEPPFAYPPNMDKKKIEKLKANLTSLGLVIANASANKATPLRIANEHWAEPSLANPKRERRERRVEYVKQVVDMAVELEAREVSIISGVFGDQIWGWYPGAFGLLEIDPVALWPGFIESLGECVDYSSDQGMKMAIETEPAMVVETVDEALRAVEEIKSNWFGIQYDIGHSISKGEDPIESVKRMGNNLFHIHMEDIIGKKHFHRVPGTGEAQLKEFIRVLKTIGYSGYVTVELYTYAHVPEQVTKQSIEYLKSIII